MPKPYPVGLLTISDRSARGERPDASGPALVEALPTDRFTVIRRGIVPDDAHAIAEALREWAEDSALVLTTGGTGLSPRDVTPEATARVLDRLAPGIAEALRADGMTRTPFAMLSRGIAGVRGRCLIVNLPGSPKAVREGMAVLLPVLEHALALLAGEAPHD